jgi:hypothetical protein
MRKDTATKKAAKHPPASQVEVARVVPQPAARFDIFLIWMMFLNDPPFRGIFYAHVPTGKDFTNYQLLHIIQ